MRVTKLPDLPAFRPSTRHVTRPVTLRLRAPVTLRLLGFLGVRYVVTTRLALDQPLRCQPCLDTLHQRYRVCSPLVRCHRREANFKRALHIDVTPVAPFIRLPVVKPAKACVYIGWHVLHVGRIDWLISTRRHKYLDRLVLISPGSLAHGNSHFGIIRRLAALGYFSLPQKPVEATIALSIAFVASELIKMRPGEIRLSEACPWIVAFTFGLLHGFGFAGALREIGLPRSDVPLALLTFNLGVEAGQLMFVAGLSIAYEAVGSLVKIPTAPSRVAAAYVIGTAAMVWLIARLDSFLI
jgi:HupE / UreJ protein